MQKGRKRRVGAISRLLDLPGEALARTSAITLTSDCEALVAGCRRILVYECDRVVLSLCDCRVTFEGEDLIMRTYFGNQIRICGRITGVIYG